MNWNSILYKLHRKLGMIIFIPVFMWVFSGFMHPFMAHWFKPSIEHSFLPPQVIDETFVGLPLQEVLTQNKLQHVEDCRVISFDNEWYYQVAIQEDSLIYFTAKTGLLVNGIDKKYAIDLARKHVADTVSAVQNAVVLHNYTEHYQAINRLLPVWEITFDRADGMTLYIDTKTSQMGTYNENNRKWFITIFDLFHKWEFFGDNYYLRVVVVTVLSALTFVTAVLGLIIYGFGYKRFKNQTIQTSYLKRRKTHRVVGLSAVLFMLLFSFSGWYHAFQKFEMDDRNAFFDTSKTASTSLLANPFQVGVKGTSIATINNESYWRITADSVRYIKTTDGSLLQAGEQLYAEELARKFYAVKESKIIETTLITAFEGEYGFVNKRLPVMKVVFDSPKLDTYYIDTATGKLAAKVNNDSRLEGYSFAMLHKFHFLDGLGRNTRDVFTILAALSLVVVAGFGIALVIKK